MIEVTPEDRAAGWKEIPARMANGQIVLVRVSRIEVMDIIKTGSSSDSDESRIGLLCKATGRQPEFVSRLDPVAQIEMLSIVGSLMDMNMGRVNLELDRVRTLNRPGIGN